MDEHDYYDRDYARDKFEEGGGYNPWEKINIDLGGYNSAIDIQALQILECLQAGNLSPASTLAMSAEHVELFKYIFCSSGLCEYGTSPRGCWPSDKDEFRKFIDNWKAYLKVEWGPDFDWDEAKLQRWGHEHTTFVSSYYHYPSGGSSSPEPPEGSVRIA